MPAADVMEFVAGYEDTDCAIIALAMYLGIPYPDVLRATTKVVGDAGRQGLLVKEIRRVAKRLGTPLVYRRRVDLDEDYGILSLPGHVVVLRNGLVFDGAFVWDAHDYLKTKNLRRPSGVLTTADPERG